MPHASPALRRWLTPLLLFLLIILVSGSAFMRKYLGPVTPDQLLFHLQYGGLDYADPRMLSRALRYLAGTLLLTGLATWALRRISLRLQRGLWMLLLGGAAFSVSATVDDPCDDEQADAIAVRYVDPATQRFEQAESPPDLLVVFIESLDERFAEASPGHAPALSELAAWRDQGRRFGEMRTLGGSSWTVGGLFSALCGVPLQPVGLMSRHALEYSTRFFDGGACLTDVLARQGWELSFYGGASLKFAGKGLFMAKHQVDRRFGREQWQEQGVGVPGAGWGLLDAALTEHAWADMQRPREGSKPRASLLLTVNTHGPAGTADPGCGQSEDGELSTDEQMARALACTDHVVAQLARRFATQADGRRKLVWIMGDHIAPTPLLFDGTDEQWRKRSHVSHAGPLRWQGPRRVAACGTSTHVQPSWTCCPRWPRPWACDGSRRPIAWVWVFHCSRRSNRPRCWSSRALSAAMPSWPAPRPCSTACGWIGLRPRVSAAGAPAPGPDARSFRRRCPAGRGPRRAGHACPARSAGSHS